MFTSLASMLLLLAPMPQRHEIPEDHPGHRHAEHPNLMGIKVGYVSLFAPEHPLEGPQGHEHRPQGFVGLFYERSVIHGWLELELTPGLIVDAEEIGLPIDLYFKKPFHPSPRTTPYVGVGPHVEVLLRPELRTLVGGSVTAGAYLWLSPRWGLDADLEFTIATGRASGRRELFYDVLLAIGPVARF